MHPARLVLRVQSGASVLRAVLEHRVHLALRVYRESPAHLVYRVQSALRDLSVHLV